MVSIKGEKQQAIKRGKLPFKQELICQCPQGKEFPWKPHTGQSYHSTSNTFKPITVSHTRPVSHSNTNSHTHSHTDCVISTHTAGSNKLGFTLPFCPYPSHTFFYTWTSTHILEANSHWHQNSMSRFQWKNAKRNFLTPAKWPSNRPCGPTWWIKVVDNKNPTLWLKLWHLASAAKWLQPASDSHVGILLC